MPVNIYRITAEGQRADEVAWLCNNQWRLPDQVEALEAWLFENASRLPADRYIADIGFMPREDARGGGSALTPGMMRSMADLGMSLFLSEYPADETER